MKYLAGLFLALGISGMAMAADDASAPPTYTAGQEYQVISPAQPTSAGPGKVEVIEFFWYGCPHCYAFEPFLEDWLAHKPDNVVFRRIPAMANPNWQIQARAYYTAEALGVLDQLHEPIFDEIHKNRHFLNSEEDFKTFFVAHGVNPDDFDKAFHSFDVETKLRRADVLERRYRVSGVPTVIVNGKYMTDNTMTRGYASLIKVTDYLVKQELAHKDAS